MDIVTSLLTGLPLTLAGVLVIWMGRRGARGTLKRNPYMGVRTAATMRSDAAWIAAHRAVATPTVIGGAGILAAGLIALFLPSSAGVFVILGGAVWGLAWLVGTIGIATRAANAASDTPGHTGTLI
ncbi:SdpI family protein [Mycetocola tolaasinivorans]|uniref:SdpI family protein n=1 Tax=Mycetocola tolaasinivorans TaxID=76635 RepID=A0A3L7A5I1_9MICO|nr:SdpI family protein [Mycetocola tolaasinivorans]RLP75354.1 SdpI family protein [Mycetocola tolaasinivorans]